MRASLLVVVVSAASVLVGCRREPSPSPAPETQGATQLDPSAAARGLRIVKARADGDVAKLVREERRKAVAEGRELVVYVGAKWCEPCVRFHDAAQRGELDADFPNVTLLELDVDEDGDALRAAGYASNLIPLFALPREDGRASERRFEGGIKGDRAVSYLAPRLRTLLQK